MLEASPALADAHRVAVRPHARRRVSGHEPAPGAHPARQCAATHRNITVVGDDAQSIYSFRGANIRNILDFPKQFEGTTVVALEQNYRSTQPILDVTNTVISRARRALHEEPLHAAHGRRGAGARGTRRTSSEQTRLVVDRILELHEEGMPLREMAVLFRAGYMSADLEIELTKRKIPFEKWGGLKFLEAAHVKDVLAFLRILENPRDEVSWYPRASCSFPVSATRRRARRSISSSRAGGIRRRSRRSPLRRARVRPGRHSSSSSASLRDGNVDRAVPTEIAALRRMYDAILRERYDRAEPRLADLDQLEIIAAKFPSRAAFLSELALEPPSATQDLASGSSTDDDALILSTAHSAKGREWDAVFVIWAVDGWFPSSRALRSDDEMEEERRLMYVAMTRARHHLAVLYPLNSYGSRWGSDYTIDQLSRFIDVGVRDRMRRMAAYPAPAPVLAPEQPPGTPLDLRALLRGRFGAP